MNRAYLLLLVSGPGWEATVNLRYLFSYTMSGGIEENKKTKK
jgi:hypothetical protein